MNVEGRNLLSLQRDAIEAASKTYEKAFRNDPLFTRLLPEEKLRRNKIRLIFELFLRYATYFGEVYATSEAWEGITMWIPSEHVVMTPEKMAQAGCLEVTQKIGNEFLDTWGELFEHLEKKHREVAPFKHYYLAGMAVQPESQGKGYSGALMRPMFQRLDQQGIPCYLETQNEKNVALYEHFGFEVMDVFIVPKIEANCWAMLRKNP